MSNDKQSPWTYSPTDQEMAYLMESLGGFFEDEFLTDILYKVRVGKEATCYCCRAALRTHLGLIAAKVYRPRMFRAMRNDWYYRLGRTMTTGGRGSAFRGRALRALKKHTRFGKQIENFSWLNNELEQLTHFHKLGADVPKPLGNSSSAILMEFFGDQTRAAPTLQMVSLSPPEASDLFDRILGNIELESESGSGPLNRLESGSGPLNRL